MIQGKMQLDEWLPIISKEYLQDFIKQGGAAVKFLVHIDCTDPTEIKNKLNNIAQDSGFTFAKVDASTVKVHLVEQLFFEIAKQIDWDDTAYVFLRQILQEHFKLPDNRSDFDLRKIAALNAYEERDFRFEVNKRLKDSLFRDYSMTQEFRIAMMILCRSLIEPDDKSVEMCISIKEWLRGELRLLSTVKKAMLYQKIGRHNARHLLLSLSHWLKLCGKGGLVLLIDISRYLQDKPKERDLSTFYYSLAGVVECYELLRQFIDGTDESDYCFITVLAPSRFVDEQDKRSVSSYDALKLRIWNEVRDVHYVNPLASMVRISCCENSVENVEK